MLSESGASSILKLDGTSDIALSGSECCALGLDSLLKIRLHVWSERRGKIPFPLPFCGSPVITE